MTNVDRTDTTTAKTDATGPARGTLAVVLGALGVFAAVWAFWMVVPGVAFGVAAIVLGLRARNRSAREAGSVALALGIVALLLVPSVLFIVSEAESWGRDCALNPTTDPNC